jgi:hypothetical protein
MLAKDPQMARKLADRAEIAGGTSDPKIARNIVMIRSMAPDAADANFAVNTPAPSPVPHAMAAAPQAAPRVPVAVNAMPQQSAPFVQLPAPVASNPRPQFTPVNAGVIDAAPQMAQQGSGVVMQRVPVDPLAGPVQSKTAATHAPRALQPKLAKDSANDMSTVRAEAPKQAPTPPMPAPGVQSAASQADDLQARAEAMAKQLVNKPAAIAAAKAEANKEGAGKTVAAKPAALAAKTAEAKPVTKVLPPKALEPVKSAETKPAPAPKVLPPAPVKAAAAPTKDAPKSVAAKPKDTIPGLRMSANAY